LGGSREEKFVVRLFYAYNHFGQHPERLVGWFDRHMGRASGQRMNAQQL
jgi:hypothetical protein